MLIILEGPDCARKSTLARDISRRLAVTEPDAIVDHFHAGPPKTHPLDEYVTPLLHYRPGRDYHIICDRWHWGEWVYPAVLDRPTKMTYGMFMYIELFMQSRGALTVLLDPPLSELQACLEARGDALVRVDQLADIKHRFQQIQRASLTGLNFIGSPDRTTPDTVIANAIGVSSRAERLNPFITSIGHWAPDVVFFGDTRACNGTACSHRQQHSRRGPSFMPYSGTSGDYLFSAISEYPMPTHAFMNACDVDDPREYMARTNATHAIALGTQAHWKLSGLGISHSSVPHPQYIRRFHHTAKAEYGKLIMDVIGTERKEHRWKPSEEVRDRQLTP